MSPVLFVRKKDRNKRTVIGYHSLNDQIIKNYHNSKSQISTSISMALPITIVSLGVIL